METSLITAVAAAPSQSSTDGVKLEYCSNRFIRSFLLNGLFVHSVLSVLFYLLLIVSILSSMVTSGYFRSFGMSYPWASCVGCLVFFSVCTFAYFTKKVFDGIDTK